MQVIEMTDKEKLKMYMKCNKKELAKMLIQCNKLIESTIYTQAFINGRLIPKNTSKKKYNEFGGEPSLEWINKMTSKHTGY